MIAFIFIVTGLIFICLNCLVFEVLGFLFLALGGNFLRKFSDVIGKVDGLDRF
ncbi:hypothetical protein [Corynebacterium macginleyi]|uniref:hypothetical protein n=1 Tax=Corynebacterium macginleyi TaxID=38290 RepID=UPI00019C3A82|nr:hypothetical protein [Corynebacterium macginleyi]EEI14890.1 hypothetical protein HMPREF0276_0976 [Corynebacterium accolens ATCC 49725]